ncbi:MAG: hypothetical protein AB1627_00580 [Chloroflexota bacterium]
MELLLLAVTILLLGAFAVTASEFGVDSRDGFDDPHHPSNPVGIG